MISKGAGFLLFCCPPKVDEKNPTLIALFSGADYFLDFGSDVLVHFGLQISVLVSLTRARNLILPLSLPESPLPQTLILNTLIPFRIRVYEKIEGRGRYC